MSFLNIELMKLYVRPPSTVPWKRCHHVLHIHTRQVFDISHLTKVVVDPYMNLFISDIGIWCIYQPYHMRA